MRRKSLSGSKLALTLFLLSLQWCAWAAPRPQVAIIIDDIGYQRHAIDTLSALPYALSYAILPESPYRDYAVSKLHAAGRELLLHLPMQGSSNSAQEPTVLHSAMQSGQFVRNVRKLFDKVDYISGFNNHQGSVLTADAKAMRLLMSEAARVDDFFFIDSRTVAGSEAQKYATQLNVPSAARDIFLDHQPSEQFVNQQFAKLLKLAQQRGSAIAIGHPHAVTIKVLTARLPEISRAGIELVSVSKLVPAAQAPKN